MLPRHLSYLRPFKLKFALTDLGYVATILAFRRGLLYEPKDARDGEFLTLLYLND